MLKGLFIHVVFFVSGLVIVMTPLAWRIFVGNSAGRSRGFDEHVAFALVFYVAFALAGTLGFGAFLSIRRWLVGPGLPEAAWLLALLSSLPPFILFQLGAVAELAERVQVMDIQLPAALIMLPIFIILSACCAGLVFGLAGKSGHFFGKANG
jgi:hypothetical protein